jgi:CPA2 family monovalent cation:H+ antiporter-2
LPAAGLAIAAGGGKLLTGWVAAGRAGVARAGRLRAGSALIARGEFSIVIASLGADLADGPHLGALAAAFVLVTAITGPLAARALDSPAPAR